MFPRIPLVLLAIALALPASAATRMTYDINGAPTAIEWASTAFPLPYEIDARLAQAHPAAPAMINRAFAAWAALPDAQVRFTDRGIVSTAGSRTDDKIVVSLASDLLRDQGAAAVTSYTYDTNTGRMIDADIRVDASLFTGDMNTQMALQHEVGHVLGLDHSAVLSSIMYPYVGTGSAPADFDTDDRIAVAMMYPADDPMLGGATLKGRVLGDDGGIFAAQVVAVSPTGQPVGTVLTNAAGEFTLLGIPAGRYRLYVEPLDGPVEVAALQGSWRQAPARSFPTQFYGSPVDVENGKVYGNLVINVAGSVRLNPRWIGATPTERTDISLSTAPVVVRAGETFNLTVGGDGFTSGMTEFEVLNPRFRRVSDFTWSDNYVTATYALEAGATPASAVILVRSGLETATLTGGLRIYGTPRSRAVRR